MNNPASEAEEEDLEEMVEEKDWKGQDLKYLEEQRRLQEEKRKLLRPRWPLRDKDVRPDIEWSMKYRIQEFARTLMEIFELEGRGVEKSLMISIAKGMVKDGLKIFQPRKRMLLRSIGHGRFFKGKDKFLESEVDIPSAPKKKAAEEVKFGFEDDSDLEDEYIKPDYMGTRVAEEDSTNEMHPKFKYYDAESAEPEGQKDTKIKTPDKGEEKRQRRLKRRKICRLTLVRCGQTRREELGYLDGWTDRRSVLSEKGKDDVKTAAIALLNRGYKFDFVVTSALEVAKSVADTVLYATGQDGIRRYTAWELNPRHLGDLEGKTDAGMASAWGWMPNEFWAFAGPPPMTEEHPEFYRQSGGEPTGEMLHPRGETIYHVLARTKNLWEFIKHMFIRRGK